jgi:hypothetical protein
MLERRYPQEFSRPEVQLNINATANAMARSNGNSFERVVVSDLEFLGLRQHPDYKHHIPERSAREAEAERVRDQLCGTLDKEGFSGVVISQSADAEFRRRRAEVRAKTEKIFREKGWIKEGDSSSQPAEEPAGPELSGHLTREGQSGVVISETKAAENRRRIADVDAEIAAARF